VKGSSSEKRIMERQKLLRTFEKVSRLELGISQAAVAAVASRLLAWSRLRCIEFSSRAGRLLRHSALAFC